MTTQLVTVSAGIIFNFECLGVWYFVRRKRSERLRERFGPEYDKTVSMHHDQQRAEAELTKREDRVRKFNIVSLPRDERVRYQETVYWFKAGSWISPRSHSRTQIVWLKR